jgi:hypothetical protein
MSSSGMLGRLALVRTDISEERSASIIRVTIIGELGRLAVISKLFWRLCVRIQTGSPGSLALLHRGFSQ